VQILNLNLFVQDKENITHTSSAVSAEKDEDEIDSVAEYISEVVAKSFKAIKNKNKPSRHLPPHKHMAVKMIELKQPKFLITEISFKIINNCAFIKQYHYRYYKEIIDPPLAA
jgi:hypothetical protein